MTAGAILRDILTTGRNLAWRHLGGKRLPVRKGSRSEEDVWCRSLAKSITSIACLLKREMERNDN